MKKVLFVATVDSHIKHFHIPYLKYFKEQGYEVHIATNGEDEIPYCDVKHTISLERSPLKLNNIKAIKQLKNIIEKEKFDIIHCHTPMGGVVARIAAKNIRSSKTRVIYTAHGFHFYKGAPLLNWLIYYPIEKYLSKYTDTLITINEEDYNLAKKKFKARNIELVHGVGVDDSKFNIEMSDKEKHDLRTSLGLKDDDYTIISIGELNKNKNQIMQIEAMKEIVSENKNIKLLMVGNGTLKDLYKAKIKQYSLEESIKLLGYRSDIPKLLKISNLLISTSKREGLPVNIIEGLMSEIQVIATNCRGNRDLIPKENLVEINDIQTLKEKILHIENKNNINTDLYKLENILREMNDIYEKQVS